LANQVDQIITPSNFVAHLLKSYGVKNLIKIIPTGVTLPQDLIPFSLSSRRLSLKGQANFIYVGRLAKEKNLDLLLKAFQFVRNNGLSSARLIMVGDGPERAKIEKKIIDMKLRGSVDLVGWQPHERVFSYFAQADIFVFPSKTESQGIVLLEAMLCGKPCIAVEAGGVPEIIDNSCGVLVGNNYQEMAIAMINLANSVDQYEFLSQQAIKHAQYFTPALQATRIEKIYQLFSD
jgi:glycosyltransferase involved in cell wall biosynthesis